MVSTSPRTPRLSQLGYRVRSECRPPLPGDECIPGSTPLRSRHRQHAWGARTGPGPPVAEQINAGARFLAESEKAIPVAAAFWSSVRTENWALCIASDQFRDEKRRAARSEWSVSRVVLCDPELDPFPITLLEPTDPLARWPSIISDSTRVNLCVCETAPSVTLASMRFTSTRRRLRFRRSGGPVRGRGCSAIHRVKGRLRASQSGPRTPASGSAESRSRARESTGPACRTRIATHAAPTRR